VNDDEITDFEDPLSAAVDHPLLGQRVTVVLAREGDVDGRLLMETWAFANEASFFDNDPPRLDRDVTLTGVLLKLEAGGSVGVVQDDGVTMWGWPALDIIEAPA
jgi:hypothetical protein